MPRLTIDMLEDERPRYIRHLADNFRVHKVAQSDETGSHGCGDGNVVEHLPDTHFCAAAVEPESDD